jgi:ankyrin repeat protein
MKNYLLCWSVLLFLPASVRAARDWRNEDVIQGKKYSRLLPGLHAFYVACENSKQQFASLNDHIAHNRYEEFRTLLSSMKRDNVNLNKLPEDWAVSCGLMRVHLPLMVAVFYNREAMIGDLVQAGADVTAVNHHQCGTVLHQLMNGRDDEQTVFIADLLLSKVPEEKKESFINGDGLRGTCPLGLAVRNCSVSHVRFLIQHGANVNSDIYTPSNKTPLKFTALHQACMQPLCSYTTIDDSAIVRLLLEAGADATIKWVSDALPEDLTGDSAIKEMLRNAPAIRSSYVAQLAREKTKEYWEQLAREELALYSDSDSEEYFDAQSGDESVMPD